LLLTGLRVVESEGTIKEFVAATVTVVPVPTLLSENLTASTASTELSDGTVTLAGVEETLAVEITTPLMLSATIGLALAGVAPISDSRSPPASNDEINDFLETDMPYSIQILNLGYFPDFLTLAPLACILWINTL
jgi:hypothetical protein